MGTVLLPWNHSTVTVSPEGAASTFQIPSEARARSAVTSGRNQLETRQATLLSAELSLWKDLRTIQMPALQTCPVFKIGLPPYQSDGALEGFWDHKFILEGTSRSSSPASCSKQNQTWWQLQFRDEDTLETPLCTVHKVKILVHIQYRKSDFPVQPAAGVSYRSQSLCRRYQDNHLSSERCLQ